MIYRQLSITNVEQKQRNEKDILIYFFNILLSRSVIDIAETSLLKASIIDYFLFDYLIVTILLKAKN